MIESVRPRRDRIREPTDGSGYLHTNRTRAPTGGSHPATSKIQQSIRRSLDPQPSVQDPCKMSGKETYEEVVWHASRYERLA